jgi:hypothetical protein
MASTGRGSSSGRSPVIVAPQAIFTKGKKISTVLCKDRIGEEVFEELEKINTRPKPFEFYTASDLWTDEHTSEQMLAFHLNENIDVSSRNAVFIDCSVE